MTRVGICLLVIIHLTRLAVGQGPYGCQDKRNVTLQEGENYVMTSDNFGTGAGPYRPYTWCRSKIHAPNGKSLKVHFTAFEVEQSDRCAADNVKIFDLARDGAETTLDNGRQCSGNDQVVPVVGPACGSEIPPGYTSRGNGIVLDFCADYGMEARGWRAEIQVVESTVVQPPPPCGREIRLESLADVVEISSPNYPENYGNLENCTWDIRFNSKYPLRVDALSFAIGRDCGDSLEIFDPENNVTMEYCGSNALQSLTFSNTSHVQIRFRSDTWDTYQGFLIALSLVPCPTGFQACDDFDGCVRPKDQCDGIRHCRDGSDERVDYCAPECGVSHFPVHDQPPIRIVGGIEANRYSIPWQVAMKNKGGGQFCGGTVISDRWLLTAAHCFTGGPSSASRYVGRIGGHDLTLSPEEDLADEYEFESVLCHPYFRGNPTDYDYCLIKTKEKIKFRKNIVPACLPRQGEDVEHGTQCLTSGWGNTGSRSVVNGFDTVEVVEKANDNRAGDPLRHVMVPVANRTYCNQAYGGQISTTMLCAGLEQGGRDTCQGDSGGPFMCRNRYGRYMVSGVVSWGRGCALPGYPGVYANTGEAISWIINTITSN